MPIIEIKASLSGYCRGYSTHRVEVTEEQLTKLKRGEYDLSEFFWEGEEVDSLITRDDREGDDYELVEEK